MTLEQYQRASLATFAFREASHTGSLNCMKAVCYVMQNRQRAGWGDGSWINILENSDQFSGHEGRTYPKIDVQNRLFQLLLRDIDDVYYVAGDDETRATVDKALYYHFVTFPIREWFVENIIRQPSAHRRGATIGSSLKLFD